MSKPITISEAESEAALREYADFVRGIFAPDVAEAAVARVMASKPNRSAEGVIKFEDEIALDGKGEHITSLYKSKDALHVRFEAKVGAGDPTDTCRVLFTPTAYIKMTALVQETSSEIAWHGVTERVADAEVPTFLVRDIVCHPQIVTGATVDVDPLEYQTWMLETLPDEQYNNLRLQGHSHVSMSCSPSATDLEHREEILSVIPESQYYIFLIWNKRGEHTACVMDMLNNKRYDDSEVEVDIQTEGQALTEFVSEAKAMLRHPTPTAPVTQFSTYGSHGSYANYGGYSYVSTPSTPSTTSTPSATPATPAANAKPAKAAGIGRGWSGSAWYDQYDAQDDYESPSMGYSYYQTKGGKTK